MYKLFKNIILVLLLVFVLDRGLGLVIEHYLFTEKQGDSSTTSHAIMRINEDVIVFGSSRAGHHYVPKIIKDSIGLSCYNVGRDGMKIYYYETLLKAILSYHTPKVVILDLNLTDFEKKKDDTEKQIYLAAILPYINQNKQIAEAVYNENKLEFYKAKISYLYRLNSLPASIIQHHLGIGQKNTNGYEPLAGSKLKQATDVKYENNSDYKESAEKIKAFERFVKIVKDKHIKLYVVISPSLLIPKNNALKTADVVLSRYGLLCYDYSQLDSLKGPKFFRDMEHLNNDGATIFTNRLIKDVLKSDTTQR